MFDFFTKKEIVVESCQIDYVEDYEDATPISEYFYKETGVTFDKQIIILRNKLVAFCRQRKISSFSTLLLNIKSDKQLKQELTDYLTTNETYFYREVKQIQELVELVKNSNTNVDILCAPSATGEEPYSIAIALLESGVSANKFKIVGIDINSEAISKANLARYLEINLRNLSKDMINNYFIKDDKNFTLEENIKSLVSFKIVNIFDESFKNIGKFDFIFSRNMLIYFDKQTKLKAKKILESIRKDENNDIFFGHADLFSIK